MHPTRIEVDLKQLKKNISNIRKRIGDRLFLLPVKANAYGLGLVQVAKAAVSAGVDYLGVAFASEALELRKKRINAKILVFGALLEEEIEELILNGVELTLSSHYKADLVAKICEKIQKKCLVHLEVDTGMCRTGMKVPTAEKLFIKLKNYPFIEVVGVYSHLATSDKKNCPICLLQLKSFDFLIKKIDPESRLLSHIANSGGVENYPGKLCFRQMVRVGLLTYGYPKNPNEFKDVKPCFSLKSKVSFFKVLEKNTGVSYGHQYKTKIQSRIVTIPIGYGDGYRRMLSNKAQVIIRGKRFPVVGSICMDQLMVEIGQDEAFVGDEVVLIGKMGDEEIPLKEIAELSESVIYEVFSGFTQRIPRVYLD